MWGTAVTADSLYLGQEEIAIRQADHLSDLLRTIPGVDIGGTHSVNSRINIRGLDDRNLAIYIDGALQTNYLYHHIGNLLINADILRSADVALGANTVTHGGIGGAVHFETMSAADLLQGADQRFGGRIAASYASNAQVGGSLTGYGQITDQLDGLIYFNHVDRDNFEDGDGRETIGSDGETNNLLARLGFDITPNQRLALSYDRLEDSGDYTQRPDMGVLTNAAITGNILLPTEYERETINLSYRGDFGDALNLRATYYTNDLRLWRDETNPAIPGGIAAMREVTSDNQGVNVLAETRLDTGPLSHTFRYGVDWFDQNLSYVADIGAGSPPVDQSAEALGIFVEDEIGFGDRFFLRPGARFNDYEITYDATGDSGSWDEMTYGLAGELIAFEGFSLLASYTEIFQGPEPAEPFAGGGANKIINPGLEPETGDNVELGFRYASYFEDARIHVGANWFRTTIDGYIGEAAVPGTTTGQTWDVNLGTAEIEGVEFSAGFGYGNFDALLTHASADLDASRLNTGGLTENIREVGDSYGLEFSYVWPNAGVTANLNTQIISPLTTFNGEVKPGYSVVNLYTRWDDALTVDGLSLTFGIDNLLDEAYTSHASRTGTTNHPRFGPLVLYDVEPGRNVKLTVAMRF